MVHMNRALGLRSGIVIGVPIPERYAMDATEMNAVIAQALGDAERKGIYGKEVTPFILSAVSQLTRGKSLESSKIIRCGTIACIRWVYAKLFVLVFLLSDMALIKNNARVAAEIAVELARIENGSSTPANHSNNAKVDANSVGAPVS